MCEGWWTEARNADERSGMQARGTKQRELVEDTPRELLWIESGSLVRDFWSAVEYGGIPEFLGRQTAVAMVVGIVSKMAAANKCNR